ncbi:MAG: hypothetical protein ACI4IS_01495 [Acutalibacteraceae bacterium]
MPQCDFFGINRKNSKNIKINQVNGKAKRLKGSKQRNDYAENQSKRMNRLAKHSLDEDNKKMYSQRAEKWQEKAEEIEEKLNEPVANSGESGIIDTRHYVKGNYSVNFGKSFGEKPISRQLAEIYSNEFDKMVDLFGKIESVGSVDVRGYENNGIFGSYNDNSGILTIYGAGGKSGIEQLSKIAKEHKKSGQWSTSSYLHTYRHELGHALQNQLSISDSMYEEKLEKIERLRQGLLEKFKNNVSDIGKYKANTLSIYGFDSLDDFISESVAEYLNGKPRETAQKVIDILRGG